ncbi:MAG: hypothetical protein EBS01_16150, partial [Verrucomicrobia bacterium]|nr:hypothetical protein [Verrucomicrobiota bacterium]
MLWDAPSFAGIEQRMVVSGSSVSVEFMQVLAPVLSRTPDRQVFASGETVTISLGTLPFDSIVQWSRNGVAIGGVQSGTLVLGSLAAVDDGTYSAVVASNGRTASVDAGTVSVIAITQQPPLKTVVAPGAPFALSVGATSSAPLSYQWLQNGNALAGGTAATFEVGAADLASTGSYSVVVFSGSVGVQSGMSRVVLAPAVTSALSAYVLAGEVLNYQITGSGSPTEFFASGLLPGFVLNTATGIISGSSGVVGGTVATIGVRNADGQGTAQFSMTVTPVSVSIPASLSYNGPVVELGSDLTFSVSPLGTPPFSYQWRRNGLPIDGGTSAVLQIPHSTLAAGGSYDVVVTNGGGSTAANPVSLDLVGIAAHPAA